jgi:putative SOS response-associated peptidase YedK
MCGRFTRSSPPAALAEELGVPIDLALVARPRFNVCPSEDVLVVARATPGAVAADGSGARPSADAAPVVAAGAMRWGLVPWFARDPKAGPRSINARAETLATNRTFRDAFARRRCLVVADGFYEWRKVGADRQPYFLRLRSRRPFVFAGVWDRWKPPTGDPLLSCAIVTCAPNGLVAPIHDRMPVIVPAAERMRWLAADATPAELAMLLRPYPEDEMEAYPVARLVNAVRNDKPECIRRVESPTVGTTSGV